jgi:hypothetical protein
MNTLVAKARKEETSESGMTYEIDSLFAFADKDVVLVQKIRMSLVARPSHVDRYDVQMIKSYIYVSLISLYGTSS